MNAAILIERLERFNTPEFRLRSGSGVGVNSHVDVCAMQAVAWLAGEGNTDAPECASRVIGGYVIRLNDSQLFRGHRDDLKPFLPRIVGSRAGRDVEIRRSLIATDYAVRVFTPIRLRAIGREEWAVELESLPPIEGKLSAEHARDAARKIRVVAAAAAAAAAAAYAAAAAAVYAAAAADAAVYADAAAAAAADAAAAAASDAAAAVYAAAYAAAAAAADAAAAAASAAASAADVLRARALECLDAMIEAA